MSIDFDADTGRLRLSRSDFAALVAWAGGGAPPDVALASLVDAGVLRGGRPHAVVQPLLEAVTDPVCRFTVQRDGADHASGWATLGAAAVLLPLPGDRCEVAGLHPSFVPAGLARLMGLGPRRRHPGEPWQLPAGVLTAVLASSDDEREAALADVDQEAVAQAGDHAQVVVEALAAGRCRRWTVAVEWSPAPGEPGGRALDLLDASPFGVWLLEPAGNRVLVWPATTTAVWRSLTRLLPDDHELAGTP